MIAYVDASVLLRIILAEADPLPSWQTIEPVSSELIRVEALRVLDRARLAFQHDDEEAAEYRAAALETLRALSLAPISTSVLERAADPFPTSLGTLDAIHLATALEIRDEFPDLRFATHDRELATAARSVGFEVQGA
jgi:predicted nucleic acid-binding protein